MSYAPKYSILFLFIFSFYTCNTIEENNSIKNKHDYTQSSYENLQYFETKMLNLNWSSIIYPKKSHLTKNVNQDSLDVLITQLFETLSKEISYYNEDRNNLNLLLKNSFFCRIRYVNENHTLKKLHWVQNTPYFPNQCNPNEYNDLPVNQKDSIKTVRYLSNGIKSISTHKVCPANFNNDKNISEIIYSIYKYYLLDENEFLIVEYLR